MAGGELVDYSGARYKDDEYEVEQHYGHSGIRHGKKTCNGVPGCRITKPAKSKSKTATNNKASKGSPERNRRV